MESTSFSNATAEIPYPIDYYGFCMPTETIPPQKVEALYYQTGYAARLIHSVLRKSGFKQTSELDDANLVVGGNLASEDKYLRYYHQRTNHYDHTFALGSKAGYHNIMRQFERRFGEMPSFYPETYLLPEEYSLMVDAFPKSKLWIQKPAGGSRGNGINVISTVPARTFKKTVVQNYLDNPLLINGLKFDLRFYVAVTSLVPLRIYLFDNGLVRLATDPYDENHDNITNRSAHLTNFSINKESENFHVTNDISEDGKGNKWSHRPFWPWLKANGYDPDEIRRKIEDAFVTTIIASRETFRKQDDSRSSFELFGFDVMISKAGDIHILEVNVSPALGTSSNLDMFIKAPLVKDLFNIALVPHPSDVCNTIEKLATERKDEKACAAIAICEYEAANKREGGFHCIYPTKERVESHRKYIEKFEPEDEVLAKWISLPEGEEKQEYITGLLKHLDECVKNEKDE